MLHSENLIVTPDDSDERLSGDLDIFKIENMPRFKEYIETIGGDFLKNLGAWTNVLLGKEFPPQGVIMGPFGSLVRDERGIDNAKPEELYSPRGIQAIKWALQEYRRNGAGLGVSSTFRDTHFRIVNDKDWELQDEPLVLPNEYERSNRLMVLFAQQIYGKKVAASISPLFDTSGKHDKKIQEYREEYSEGKLIDLIMQRQGPQVQVLHHAGVYTIWGEAFRYRDEAIAVARLAKELGVQSLVICFEANEKGVPDPEYDETFQELERDLQREAGPGVKVTVGVNCTGVDNIEKMWARGDQVKIAYPNRLNFNDKHKSVFSDLVENQHKTEEDKAEITRMEKYHNTPFYRWIRFYRNAFLEYGVELAGGCCGTTPEHTWVARCAFIEAQALMGRKPRRNGQIIHLG